MTHATREPGQPSNPDELDKLFSAYFRHQLPKQWPEFRPHFIASPIGHQANTKSGRSRATLAVAVAVLFGTGLYLSSGSHPLPQMDNAQTTETGLLEKANAKGPDLLNRPAESRESGKAIRSK
jgi:hypothetical protein